ncbi:MAG: DUF4373 domain-containing protein [Oscillospiraceae bacterium]|nr:DUF4373 domain-containing protein [Oscillospiraceae bacterium]
MNSNGIPWFPLDTHLDEKFELIEAEFGLTGFAVIVKLFQRIYGGQGYYCEWTNDVALLFGRNLDFKPNNSILTKIINAAISRGLFDKELYDKYHILTSKSIQRRYFDAVSRRKNIGVKKEYLLIPVDRILKNVNISEKNADTCEQRREENRKEEKMRKEDTKVSASAVPQSIIDLYNQNIAPMTPVVLHSMEGWLKIIDADVMEYAIKEAAGYNRRTWKYIEAILRSHSDAGRTTLDAVQDAAKKYRKNDMNLSVSESINIDYDELEKIMLGKM